MEKIPWYQSAIIRQQVIAAIIALLGLTGLGAKLGADFDAEKIVTAVFGALAVVIPLWTIFTRLFKAHPPITETAAVKEVEVQTKLGQTGFARLSLLGVILAICVTAFMLMLPGCSVNPTKTAVTTEQKADAIYGEYVIAKEAGGKILDNASVSDSVKRTVANGILRTAPIANQGHDLIIKYSEEKARAALLLQAATAENATKEAKDQLSAAQLKVQVAAQNLDRWITEGAPLLVSFIATVKGVK